jgi:hypothetical protein
LRSGFQVICVPFFPIDIQPVYLFLRLGRDLYALGGVNSSVAL